jgi:hypothetical protein
VSGVEVRPAGAGDAAPVARLLGQLGYPSSGTDVAKRVARIGELEDGPERSWAHAFYRRHGFRESPQRFLKAL